MVKSIDVTLKDNMISLRDVVACFLPWKLGFHPTKI